MPGLVDYRLSPEIALFLLVVSKNKTSKTMWKLFLWFNIYFVNLSSPLCLGQMVITFAGNGTGSSIDGWGTLATLNKPNTMISDSNGNLFVPETNGRRIRKITRDGYVSTLAGNGATTSIDGQGTWASLGNPVMLVLDKKGNLLFTDISGCKIRKINTTGYVSTYAGNGTCKTVDGPGMGAQFHRPWGLTMDSDENIYVSEESGRRIRKIGADGYVSTLAGNGSLGYIDGPATSSTFFNPRGICLDKMGNVIVADHHKIRLVTPSGQVSTIAGDTAGDKEGQGTLSQFNIAIIPVVDDYGNIFFADHGNNKIRKINSTFYMSTVAGSSAGGTADGPVGNATFKNPSGIIFDPFGNLLVADINTHRMRKIYCPSSCTAGSMASVSFGCQCVLCPVGTYQPNQNEAYCLSCPENSICTTSGRSNFSCAPGFSQSENHCVACESGITFKSGVDGPCRGCPSNSECITTGFSCQAGYSLLNDQCVSCSPGSFKNMAGNSPCDPCPAGSYQRLAGQTRCDSCPGNAQCMLGSIDFQCQAGFLMSNTNQSCFPVVTTSTALPSKPSNFWLQFWIEQPMIAIAIFGAFILILLVLGFLLGFMLHPKRNLEKRDELSQNASGTSAVIMNRSSTAPLQRERSIYSDRSAGDRRSTSSSRRQTSSNRRAR